MGIREAARRSGVAAVFRDAALDGLVERMGRIVMLSEIKNGDLFYIPPREMCPNASSRLHMANGDAYIHEDELGDRRWSVECEYVDGRKNKNT